jgi:putative transposase
MADQNTTEVSEATATPKPEQAKATEKKTPAAKTAPKSKSAAAAAAPVRKLRRYTPEERSSLLAAVGSETAAGKTLKDTLVKLNLSEQTYYNWKNDGQSKAKPAAAKAATKSAPAKASEGRCCKSPRFEAILCKGSGNQGSRCKRRSQGTGLAGSRKPAPAQVARRKAAQGEC